MVSNIRKAILLTLAMGSLLTPSYAANAGGGNDTSKVNIRASLANAKTHADEINKKGKIKLSGDGSLWLPEKNAITAYEESPESKQEDMILKKTKINRLDDVGNTYTADSLDPVDQYDFVVGEWELNRSINDIDKPVPSKLLEQGDFRTYTYPGVEASVYAGPTTTSKRHSDPLLAYTGHYWYEAGNIAALHITDKKLHTIRDIGLGNSRGEVVFSYGAPNAMWKNLKTGEVLFAYVWDLQGRAGQSRTMTSDDEKASTTSRKYLVFTFKESKVIAIDMVDGQVWARFSAPQTTMHTYRVNQLTDDDFVLHGRRIGNHFVNDGDQSWKTQGEIYGSPFIGYDDYAVSAGQDHLINRVYVNLDTPTRRGICIGDTSYLMLFVYGRPQRVYQEFNGNKSMRVYQYRNPNKENEYLIFVVDAKTKFIKNIMLSDRPTDQLH